MTLVGGLVWHHAHKNAPGATHSNLQQRTARAAQHGLRAAPGAPPAHNAYAPRVSRIAYTRYATRAFIMGAPAYAHIYLRQHTRGLQCNATVGTSHCRYRLTCLTTSLYCSSRSWFAQRAVMAYKQHAPAAFCAHRGWAAFTHVAPPARRAKLRDARAVARLAARASLSARYVSCRATRCLVCRARTVRTRVRASTSPATLRGPPHVIAFASTGAGVRHSVAAATSGALARAWTGCSVSSRRGHAFADGCTRAFSPPHGSGMRASLYELWLLGARISRARPVGTDHGDDVGKRLWCGRRASGKAATKSPPSAPLIPHGRAPEGPGDQRTTHCLPGRPQGQTQDHSSYSYPTTPGPPPGSRGHPVLDCAPRQSTCSLRTAHTAPRLFTASIPLYRALRAGRSRIAHALRNTAPYLSHYTTTHALHHKRERALFF